MKFCEQDSQKTPWGKPEKCFTVFFGDNFVNFGTILRKVAVVAFRIGFRNLLNLNLLSIIHTYSGNSEVSGNPDFDFHVSLLHSV